MKGCKTEEKELAVPKLSRTGRGEFDTTAAELAAALKPSGIVSSFGSRSAPFLSALSPCFPP